MRFEIVFRDKKLDLWRPQEGHLDPDGFGQISKPYW